LKGCRQVCQAKEYDFGLEQALISNKGSFPFIASLDMDIVIASTNIKLGKDFYILELIDDISG
jgi:hypothetical protein